MIDQTLAKQVSSLTARRSGRIIVLQMSRMPVLWLGQRFLRAILGMAVGYAWIVRVTKIPTCIDSARLGIRIISCT
jgi:hypothetical protein